MSRGTKWSITAALFAYYAIKNGQGALVLVAGLVWCVVFCAWGAARARRRLDRR